MRIALGLIAAFILAAPLPAGAAQAPSKEPKFVVHEWGVSIRSGAGEATELAPPPDLISGLPGFVLRHAQEYRPTRHNFGWDKPVLHFYGREGLPVTIQLEFPQGEPLAYWPKPNSYVEHDGKQITSRKEMMIYAYTHAIGCDWKGTLSAKPAFPLAAAPSENWWSGVRDVPGMYFNAASNSSERFLFYEATARQQPPVSASVSDDAIVIRNTADAASGEVIVLINDGKSRWIDTVDSIPPHGEISLAKDRLTGQASTDEQTLRACQAQWTNAGMTDAEAAAIVQTWKPDLLGRVGFLLISRMPAKSYDAMFPLVITPRPDELTRVGMVFDPLDGQASRAAWLPALQRIFDGFAKQLGDDDFKVRRAAEQRFASFGDLAKKYLIELSKQTDPEVANSARVLLKELEPKPAAPVQEVKGTAGRREE